MSPATGLPSVTVIVPTRGRRDRIMRCLDALLTDPATTEIVVVIDGSDDGTLELLEHRAEQDRRLRPVRVSHGGLYPALQAGLERAQCDVVLAIDDDVVAQPGLVSGHARRHADGTHGLVVLGYMPTSLPQPRRPGEVATVLYADAYEWTCRRWERDEQARLEYFWGGNYSLRRDDALDLGLAPDGKPLPYHDDQEFGLRLKRAGFRAEFDRSLLARHEHRRDLETFFGEAERRALGRIMIQRIHSDHVEPLQLEHYYESLGAPARWLVRLGKERLAAALLVPPLRGAVRLGGLMRWWKLETAAAVTVLHILQLRTLLEHGSDVLSPKS